VNGGHSPPMDAPSPPPARPDRQMVGIVPLPQVRKR
jgi:hypothetical protein